MYNVKAETLQITLEYLATRPYREVVEIIKLIQESTPVEEKKEETTEK